MPTAKAPQSPTRSSSVCDIPYVMPYIHFKGKEITDEQ